MIKVSNLTKYYGNHKAVDDISFELEEGKIYGFLGPNGAGKSTTMNIMTGYIGATSGTVEINGYDILEEPEKAKLNIGYLPELPPLYQDMTVREYLMFVAELKKVNKKERKNHISEIEEKVGIAHMSDRLIKHLSKGYKQRVGFAAALVSYPSVIILDEPTVGLDPMQINEMRELIRSLREKHTVLLSSHIMQEVNAVCDTIMIISNGKLVANDTAENLSENNTEASLITYKVKADKDKIEKILNDFNEFKNVNFISTGDVTSFTVETSENVEEIQEKFFLACAGEKVIILESKVDVKSLEDVFLQLTSTTGLEEKEEEE